jgi:hypothetical protein
VIEWVGFGAAGRFFIFFSASGMGEIGKYAALGEQWSLMAVADLPAPQVHCSSPTHGLY